MTIPDTQMEAWEAIQAHIPEVDKAVLGFIQHQPRTVDEIVPLMQRVRNTVAPACTRLRQQGLIEDSGERRRTPCNRSAIVWRARA